MAATTNADMVAGKIVLLAGNDNILVDWATIDTYIIRDLRPTGQGREGAATAAVQGENTDYISYTYDEARTAYNTGMVDLGA